MATLLQRGAATRGLGLDAENEAAEVILRAERAIGQTLNAMQAEGVLRKRGDIGEGRDAETMGDLKSLEDIGISRRDAERYRLLARLGEPTFESKFATVKATGARLSKVDFYRLVKGKAEKPVSATAAYGEGFTPAVAAFTKASAFLLMNMGQVPDAELREVGINIRALADAYNAVKAARA